jgi:hypothetical protein
MSTFVLNRVRELATEEKARVSLFRNHDLQAIDAAIVKYTDREVCVALVYNHLMH